MVTLKKLQNWQSISEYTSENKGTVLFDRKEMGHPRDILNPINSIVYLHKTQCFTEVFYFEIPISSFGFFWDFIFK